jgi:hypothetical protein
MAKSAQIVVKKAYIGKISANKILASDFSIGLPKKYESNVLSF